jgi:hypothetical protein
MYDTKYTNVDIIHEYINNIHINLQLNPTHENNRRISSLDLLIIRNPSNLEIDIYRKPTTTNISINFISNYPTEHKLAAYRYHNARMQSLPLTTARQQTEWKTIKFIGRSNNFPDRIITRLKAQLQRTHQKCDKEENKKKGALFTYYSPRIRKLTSLFKHTNIRIAFRSINTIQQYTKPKTSNHNQEHKSGIYKLTCNTCKLSYIGHTNRNLKQRYQEHIHYIRNNDPQSTYAQNILNKQHEYGTITDTMTLLKHEHKTSMLIPYEQLFIQTYYQNRHLITEQNIGEPSPLFQLIINSAPTSATTIKTDQYTSKKKTPKPVPIQPR